MAETTANSSGGTGPPVDGVTVTFTPTALVAGQAIRAAIAIGDGAGTANQFATVDAANNLHVAVAPSGTGADTPFPTTISAAGTSLGVVPATNKGIHVDVPPGASFSGYIAAAQAAAAIAAPTNGALTATAGGTIAATTYYVRSTYVSATGETLGATETSLAVAVGNVLNVASPGALAGATGWYPYVSTAAGTETRQTTAPIAIGTAWVEPTSGLIAGASLPAVNTSGPIGISKTWANPPGAQQPLPLDFNLSGQQLWVTNHAPATATTFAAGTCTYRVI